METIRENYVLLAHIRFKSYYVVWKPQANDGRFHQHIQFKSYYVVWKRYLTDKGIFKGYPGLNRTM